MAKKKQENQFSEQLHEAISRWVADMSNENVENVFKVITQACLAGDVWYYPNNGEGEGMMASQIRHKDGVKYYAMFVMTELETTDNFAAECKNPSLKFYTASAEEIFEVFYEAPDSVKRLYLNYASDISFPISKQNAKAVLDCIKIVRNRKNNADNDSDNENKKVCINPKFILTEKQYRADLNALFGENEGEKWSLASYPLNADGTLTLHFENTEDSTKNCALVYTVKGKNAKLKTSFKFNINQSLTVRKLFYRRAKFYALVETQDEEFVLMQLTDGGKKIKMSPDIFDAELDAKGIFGIGLNNAIECEDGERYVVYLYSLTQNDGAMLTENANILSCSAVSLAPDGQFAWYSSPSDRICIADGEGFVSYKVALQDFDAFAFSSDEEVMIVSYTENDTAFSLYMMLKDEDDEYSQYIRISSYSKDPLPDPKKAKFFGWSSMLGNTFVLNFDYDLYIYDVDDCVKDLAPFIE